MGFASLYPSYGNRKNHPPRRRCRRFYGTADPVTCWRFWLTSRHPAAMKNAMKNPGTAAASASLFHRIMERLIVRHQCCDIDDSDDSVWRWRMESPLAPHPIKLAKALAITALVAGIVALNATAHSAPAAEPAVTGLWQKIDPQTGTADGWFLFVEHDGVYE